MADFLSQSLKSVAHALQAALRASFDMTPTEFDSFEDALKIYEEGIKLRVEPVLKEKTYVDMLKGLLYIDGAPHLKYPEPHVIKGIAIIRISCPQPTIMISFQTWQVRPLDQV